MNKQKLPIPYKKYGTFFILSNVEARYLIQNSIFYFGFNRDNFLVVCGRIFVAQFVVSEILFVKEMLPIWDRNLLHKKWTTAKTTQIICQASTKHETIITSIYIFYL